MASAEGNQEICSPFIPTQNTLRKTSAEIVSEARQLLRVQSTQRPFTPRDGHRELFGKSSARADCDNRPPSTFRFVLNLTSSSFRLQVPRLKPKFPAPCDAEDAFKVFPKPPTDPLEGKRGLAGTRARLLRAGSLPTLPPVEGHADGEEGEETFNI
uniref:Uncharacterized protein n=1 Tax=Sphaeramia orbicularis TaxID=375764 RepID=A0A672YXN6_9TELE